MLVPFHPVQPPDLESRARIEFQLNFESSVCIEVCRSRWKMNPTHGFRQIAQIFFFKFKVWVFFTSDLTDPRWDYCEPPSIKSEYSNLYDGRCWRPGIMRRTVQSFHHYYAVPSGKKSDSHTDCCFRKQHCRRVRKQRSVCKSSNSKYYHMRLFVRYRCGVL